MILLVGNNKDDLLYFETIISNKKHEVVLNKYPVTFGTISNQSVCLLCDVYTNILSSLIASYLIEKYYVLFVLKIGKMGTLSRVIKNSDVIISSKIKAIDVDITDLQGIRLGQIPSLEQVYDTKNEIYATLLNAFAKRTNIIARECTVLSSNVHYTEKRQLENIVYDDRIFGEDVNKVVFDSESFGLATACAVHEIPFVCLGVVVNHIGEEFDTHNYIGVLKQYSSVGKAVVSAIGDIGSTDVLRG